MKCMTINSEKRKYTRIKKKIYERKIKSTHILPNKITFIYLLINLVIHLLIIYK